MAGNSRRDKDDKGGGGEPRRFTFSFSTPGLVSLTVVAAAALAWAFVLGVLVGRGYKPEQAVPELAKIMPRAEDNATAQAQEKPEVLKAEELDFYDALSKKPKTDGAPPVAPKSKPKPKAEPVKQATAPSPAPVVAPAPKAETPQAQAQTSDAERFSYIYQVGSLRDPEMAGRFSAKLGSMGLKTSIETVETSSGTWHRVLVHFKGTPEDTRTLKEQLASQGVEKPIMKSKTPY